MKVKSWNHKKNQAKMAIDVVVQMELRPVGMLMAEDVMYMYQQFMLDLSGGKGMFAGSDDLTSDKLLALAQRMYEIECAEAGLKGPKTSPTIYKDAAIKKMEMGPVLSQYQLDAMMKKGELVEQIVQASNAVVAESNKINKMVALQGHKVEGTAEYLNNMKLAGPKTYGKSWLTEVQAHIDHELLKISGIDKMTEEAKIVAVGTGYVDKAIIEYINNGSKPKPGYHHNE